MRDEKVFFISGTYRVAGYESGLLFLKTPKTPKLEKSRANLSSSTYVTFDIRVSPGVRFISVTEFFKVVLDMFT